MYEDDSDRKAFLSALLEGIDPVGKKRRNAAMLSAYLERGYTMISIAEFLGLHYISVSRTVAAAKNKM